MNLLKPTFVLALLFVFSGCGNPAIYNVTNQSVPSVSKVKTVDEMKKAILAACARRGWIAQDTAPGIISANITTKMDIKAAIEIKYDAKNYSITYKDSTGFVDDAAAGSSMQRYNGWIKYLDNEIQRNLALL
jgi:hypothetical protein